MANSTYCILQNSDGTLSILNREYEGLGITERDWSRQGGKPHAMKGLRPEAPEAPAARQAAKMGGGPVSGPDRGGKKLSSPLKSARS